MSSFFTAFKAALTRKATNDADVSSGASATPIAAPVDAFAAKAAPAAIAIQPPHALSASAPEGISARVPDVRTESQQEIGSHFGLDDFANWIHSPAATDHLKELLAILNDGASSPLPLFEFEIFQFLKYVRSDESRWPLVLPNAITEALSKHTTDGFVEVSKLPPMSIVGRTLFDAFLSDNTDSIKQSRYFDSAKNRFRDLSERAQAMLLASSRRADVLRSMPAVRDVLERYKGQKPLADTYFIAVQHIWDTNKLLDEYQNLGIKWGFIIGKGQRSTDHDEFLRLKAELKSQGDNWDIAEESLHDFKAQGFDPIVDACRQMIHKIQADGITEPRIVILDEGGRAFRAFHEVSDLQPWAKYVVGVEQTAAGEANLRAMQKARAMPLQIPIYAVFKSDLKANTEGLAVGLMGVERGIASIAQLHPAFAERVQQPLDVVVLGYGAVGHATALAARNLGHRVWVLDPSEQARQRAAANSFAVARVADWEEQLQEILPHGQIVFGCAAVPESSYALSRAQRALLPSGAFMINCATGAHQFDAVDLPRDGMSPDEIAECVGPLYQLQLPDLAGPIVLGDVEDMMRTRALRTSDNKHAFLLYSGFTAGGGLPARYIDPVLALLMESLIRAEKERGTQSGGYIPIDDAIQSHISQLVTQAWPDGNAIENISIEQARREERRFRLPPSGLSQDWADYLHHMPADREGVTLGRCLQAKRHGLSFLHFAIITRARMSDTQISRLLEFDLDARDQKGRTPLHYAAMMANPNLLRFLLARGANPNAIDNNGRTILHYAYITGCYELIDILKKLDADPIAEDEYGYTPSEYLAKANIYEHKVHALKEMAEWILRYNSPKYALSFNRVVKKNIEDLVDPRNQQLYAALQRYDYQAFVLLLQKENLQTGSNSDLAQQQHDQSIFDVLRLPAPGDIYWYCMLHPTDKETVVAPSSLTELRQAAAQAEQPRTEVEKFAAHIVQAAEKSDMRLRPGAAQNIRDLAHKLDHLTTNQARLAEGERMLAQNDWHGASFIAMLATGPESDNLMQRIAEKARRAGDLKFAQEIVDLKNDPMRKGLSALTLGITIDGPPKKPQHPTHVSKKSDFAKNLRNGLKQSAARSETTSRAVRTSEIVAEQPFKDSRPIDIAGLHKVWVLAALYWAARMKMNSIVALMGVLPRKHEFLTISATDPHVETAIAYMNMKHHHLSFDRIESASIKCNLNADTLDPQNFDRDNGGPGVAASAIWRLREALAHVDPDTLREIEQQIDKKGTDR